jgi:hypothetical protein
MANVSTSEPNPDSNPENSSAHPSREPAEDKNAERVGFDDILPFNLDPSYDPREGLWDPERDSQEDAVPNETAVPEPAPPVPVVKRKRALPKSWVKVTLRAMFVLIIIAALWGLIF